jgi:GMP synthase (glutamine-hydrolysing)
VRPFLGHAERPLRDAGLTLDERHFRRDDPLPAPGEVDGLLVLGGEQHAGGDEFAGEAAVLRDFVTADLPVLGICLGGQLLARALGGQVRRTGGRTVEWRELHKTPEGERDPLFGPLPDPIPALHFNEDVFDAPPGAAILAGPAPDGTAAFRHGPSAWGVQYHPDADEPAVERWIADFAREVPDGFGELSTQHARAQAEASHTLFARFAELVARGR